MTTLDIVQYLEGKGCIVKRASAKEVHTHCFFHREEQNERGRLYINVDPSNEPPNPWFCHKCGEKGWAKHLLENFGDTIADEEAVETYDSLYHIFDTATLYYHEKLLANPTALEYLHGRGLTDESIDKFQLGWADGTLKSHLKSLGIKTDDMLKTGLVRDTGVDFFIERITIPYIINGSTVTIRGKDIEGKYFGLPGSPGKTRLYNSDSVWAADQVLICEGEFDTMIADQLGYVAVGVPGAQNWQEGWKGYISEAQRTFIVFDSDTAGDEASEKLIQKLDGIPRRVRLPVDGVDLTDWVVKHGAGPDELAELLKQSKSKLLISPTMAWEEWLENEGNPNRQGLLLGLDKFDRYLTPGLLPAQVMIVQAKTGAGKTISLLNLFQMMAIAQPDLKMMFVSLEQTRSEWFERAWRIYRLYNMIEDPVKAQKEALEFWNERIVLIDKNRISDKELRQAVYECALDYHQPGMIGLDYLGYWARAFTGDQYHRVTDAVMMLKELAKEWRIPIITPHQVNRGSEAGSEPTLGAARDSGAIEETADYLLSLWAPDQKPGRTGTNTDLQNRENKVHMRIVKSRHGGTGQRQDFQFAPLSLVLAPEGQNSQLQTRAQDEVEWYRAGDKYETAFGRHFTGSKGLGGAR